MCTHYLQNVSVHSWNTTFAVVSCEISPRVEFALTNSEIVALSHGGRSLLTQEQSGYIS